MAAKGSTSKRERRPVTKEGATETRKRRRSTNNEDADTETKTLPMGKALASTEKSVRDGAIRSLAAYLSQSNAEPLSDLEMARLWKGIFYCFWMSDKPRVQQALAQEMADIVLSIEQSKDEESDGAMRFLEGFFDAMVREWWGLDKWRVDKFMMLVRRFVGAGMRLLAQRSRQADSVQRFTSVLMKAGGVLDANNVKTPHGLLYHVCDVYLEELDKACQGLEEEETALPVAALIQPYIVLAATCHARLHYDRIFKSVLVPLLDDCLVAEKGLTRSKDKQEAFSRCQFPSVFKHAAQSPTDVRKQVYAALFKEASQSTSAEARRRQIYKLFRDEQDRLDVD